MSEKRNEPKAEPVIHPHTVGLVMPISSIDGCGPEHWAEVKSIIEDAIQSIDDPKFSARLVSDADDVGVIQKRIISGVYAADIVVCDVSGKNSNVMFELGMRLAFDKPVVIIKDDKTDYSFDTSVIEHLGYPRDLRFHAITAFKKKLADKVLATHTTYSKNPDAASFLKSFGPFNVAKIEQRESNADPAVLDMLSEIHRGLAQVNRRTMESQSRWGISGFSSSLQEEEIIYQAVKRLREGSSPEAWKIFTTDSKAAVAMLRKYVPARVISNFDEDKMSFLIANAIGRLN